MLGYVVKLTRFGEACLEMGQGRGNSATGGMPSGAARRTRALDVIIRSRLPRRRSSIQRIAVVTWRCCRSARVDTGRSNPANLIEINGTRIVLDCGMGVSRRLAEAKVPLTSLEYILISHHHSDHNLEYGNLVYNVGAEQVRR